MLLVAPRSTSMAPRKLPISQKPQSQQSLCSRHCMLTNVFQCGACARNSLKKAKWQQAQWPPRSMSRLEGFHVFLSTTHHRHRSHTGVGDAKCCMFVDMASMMIHCTSELEEERKIKIYPLAKDAQDCKKDISKGYQF